MSGNGFFWYDTGQNHLMNDATFRNCGYRSAEYSEYDSSPDRGCGEEDANGCHRNSVVFGLLTHSDQFTPELMQATKKIAFDNCGRRFDLSRWDEDKYPSSVSGRNQNWIDTDGTVSGLNEPTIIGSGLSDVESWWQVENDGAFSEDATMCAWQIDFSSHFLFEFVFKHVSRSGQSRTATIH